MHCFPHLNKSFRHARRFATCATVGLAVMMLSTEAAPADPISFKPVAPPPATFEYSSVSETVRQPFTIENSGSTPQTLQVVAPPVHQMGGLQCSAVTPDCTLGWHVRGHAVPPGQPYSLMLEAKTSAELVLQGVAKSPGTYRAEVSVQGSGFAPLSAVIVVKRPVINLGANALILGPGGIRYPAWPFQDLKPLTLTIANGSELPIQLAVLPEVQILRDDGTSTFSLDAGREKAFCPGPPLPRPISVGAMVACTVPLSSLSAAGRYRAVLELTQAGIAPVTASRDFTVRLAWFWAFSAVLAGAVFGASFAGWQNSGRRRALQSADALELRSSFTAIINDVSGAPAPAITPELVQEIIVRLDQMLTALASTSTADFASDIAGLGSRLPFVHRFATLEMAYFQAGTPGTATTAYNDAAAAIEKSPPPGDLPAKLDALATELKKAAAAGVRIGAARVAGADATSPNQFFFKWSTRSPERLLRMVRSIDTVILLVTILLVALIGVVTLWQSNATWGSLGDILVALFTGFAATAAGTLGLRELTNGYTLGRIAGK